MGNALKLNVENGFALDEHQILLGVQTAINNNAQWYQEREMVFSTTHQKALGFYKLALTGFKNCNSGEVPHYAKKAHEMLESDTKGNIPPIPNYEERHLQRLRGS